MPTLLAEDDEYNVLEFQPSSIRGVSGVAQINVVEIIPIIESAPVATARTISPKDAASCSGGESTHLCRGSV